MIGIINKIQTVQGLIHYHFSKVEAGVADLISNNLLLNDPKAIEHTMRYTTQLNTRIKKDKYRDFVLSLPKDENISNDTFEKIANEYLQKMGYSNNPAVVFKHNDKDHSHIHIVTTQIDFDGLKVNDSHDLYKSKDIVRELSIKYNLKKVIEISQENLQKSLSEKNEQKFRLTNALKKALADDQLNSKLIELINDGELINRIITEPLESSKIEYFLNRKNKLLNVRAYLIKNNLYQKTKKEDLLDKMEACLISSKNSDEYIKGLHDLNIYARIVGIGRKPYIVYGLQEQKFYLKEKEIPLKFRYLNILHKFQNVPLEISKLDRTKTEQRNYMKYRVSKAVKKSKSIEQLKTELLKMNIDTRTLSNESGTYDISFIPTNMYTPYEFNGNQLDEKKLSWSKLYSTIISNNNMTPAEIAKEQYQKPSHPGRIRLDHHEDDQIKKPNTGYDEFGQNF